jgi:hypothetical protein
MFSACYLEVSVLQYPVASHGPVIFTGFRNDRLPDQVVNRSSNAVNFCYVTFIKPKYTGFRYVQGVGAFDLLEKRDTVASRGFSMDRLRKPAIRQSKIVAYGGTQR